MSEKGERNNYNMVYNRIVDSHIHCGNYTCTDVKAVISDIITYICENNIDKCVLMSNTAQKGVLGNNDTVRTIYEICPERFAWMCNVSENSSMGIYQQLVTNKKQGACGIGELVIHKKFDDPFYENVFAAAQMLKMPVLFHISPCEEFTYGIIDNPGLPLLEKMLGKYMNLIFIGHSQPFWHEISGDALASPEERNQWGKGKVYSGGRLIYLLNNYENLYCDLSANSGGCAIMRDEEFGLWFMERYSDRLLFGSDIIGDKKRYPLLRWMKDMVENKKLERETYYKICYNNATNLFFK